MACFYQPSSDAIKNYCDPMLTSNFVKLIWLNAYSHMVVHTQACLAGKGHIQASLLILIVCLSLITLQIYFQLSPLILLQSLSRPENRLYFPRKVELEYSLRRGLLGQLLF